MDWQNLIDVGLTAALACLGWFMSTLWNSIQENKRAIHDAELHLANNYVKKDDFRDALKELKEEISSGFNRLYDEVKGKMDKHS